ncbi:MAG: RluA family pseudouridine synthase [Clostridia bacterium]|nr:RluA family pseudouridine synthase [Clostridia bacterium]
MKFTVSPELDGISVQNFLRRYCHVSARLLAKLKRVENGITCNNNPIRSIDSLKKGDIIELKMPEDIPHIEPVDLPVEIVYEDSSIVIYSKPPKMPVHPVHDHQLDTLANAAAFHALQNGESYAFRAVNRIDRDTSGLVLAAKTPYAAAFLPKRTDKIYVALCEGRLTGNGTIDAPLRLKEGHTIQREIGEGGVRAVTHYEAVENYGNDYTLLRLTLETGRTHQIRAHFAGIGHPLAGDDMYGGSREHFPRQCLHCAELSLIHPETGERLTVRKDINFFDECI